MKPEELTKLQELTEVLVDQARRLMASLGQPYENVVVGKTVREIDNAIMKAYRQLEKARETDKVAWERTKLDGSRNAQDILEQLDQVLKALYPEDE